MVAPFDAGGARRMAHLMAADSATLLLHPADTLWSQFMHRLHVRYLLHRPVLSVWNAGQSPEALLKLWNRHFPQRIVLHERVAKDVERAVAANAELRSLVEAVEVWVSGESGSLLPACTEFWFHEVEATVIETPREKKSPWSSLPEEPAAFSPCTWRQVRRPGSRTIVLPRFPEPAESARARFREAARALAQVDPFDSRQSLVILYEAHRSLEQLQQTQAYSESPFLQQWSDPMREWVGRLGLYHSGVLLRIPDKVHAGGADSVQVAMEAFAWRRPELSALSVSLEAPRGWSYRPWNLESNRAPWFRGDKRLIEGNLVLKPLRGALARQPGERPAPCCSLWVEAKVQGPFEGSFPLRFRLPLAVNPSVPSPRHAKEAKAGIPALTLSWESTPARQHRVSLQLSEIHLATLTQPVLWLFPREHAFHGLYHMDSLLSVPPEGPLWEHLDSLPRLWVADASALSKLDSTGDSIRTFLERGGTLLATGAPRQGWLDALDVTLSCREQPRGLDPGPIEAACLPGKGFRPFMRKGENLLAWDAEINGGRLVVYPLFLPPHRNTADGFEPDRAALAWLESLWELVHSLSLPVAPVEIR